MSNPDETLERFDRAMEQWGDECFQDPSVWHKPDHAEFQTLRDLLTPHAEAGDMRCQYALATIIWFDLCEEYETEEEMLARFDHTAACRAATRWWIAAAQQGCWPAVDNLLVEGVGPEAERIKAAAKELEEERPELVPWSHNMPCYGSNFMQELCKRIYGKADNEYFTTTY